MAMIQRRGETLCELVEKACEALWPNEPSPENLQALMTKVEDMDERLADWRDSAARVAATETLSWIMPFNDSEPS